MPPRLDLPAASCESCVGDSAPEVSGPLEWEWWLRIGRASKEAGTEGETGIPRAFLAVETLYFKQVPAPRNALFLSPGAA